MVPAPARETLRTQLQRTRWMIDRPGESTSECAVLGVAGLARNGWWSAGDRDGRRVDSESAYGIEAQAVRRRGGRAQTM
jgi:hypothetical protein